MYKTVVQLWLLYVHLIFKPLALAVIHPTS